MAMVDAAIVPSEAAPGETVLFTVKIIDPKHVVKWVDVVVDEYPDAAFDLYDDGTEGDVAAGDGIWSYEFVVPYGAPAGTYHWTFTAYDENLEFVDTGSQTGEEPVLPTATLVVE
jgi:hypothetical protein